MDPATVMACRYRRVSDASEQVKNQDRDTEDLIRQRGLTLDPRYDLEDVGSAWSKSPNLPQRARLLRDAAAGLLKGYTLVVWAADRISRDALDLSAIVRALQAAGVRVVSCKESWLDTQGPMGEVLVFLAGWAASMESKRKSERVRAALQRRKAAGGRIGRKPVAVDLASVVRMRQAGLGLRKIAKVLGVSVATVHQRLKAKKCVSETGSPGGGARV